MTKNLNVYKKEVEGGERMLQRQWDKYDNDLNSKKRYPSLMVFGASNILISRQRAYIEALEAEVKRLKKTANMDDGYIEFLEGSTNEKLNIY